MGGTVTFPFSSVTSTAAFASPSAAVSVIATVIPLTGLSSLSVTTTLILFSMSILFASGSLTDNLPSSEIVMNALAIGAFSSVTTTLYPLTLPTPFSSVISSFKGGTTIFPFSSVLSVKLFSVLSETVTEISFCGFPSLSVTVTVMRFA